MGCEVWTLAAIKMSEGIIYTLVDCLNIFRTEEVQFSNNYSCSQYCSCYNILGLTTLKLHLFHEKIPVQDRGSANDLFVGSGVIYKVDYDICLTCTKILL